jgi:hypothetical protein
VLEDLLLLRRLDGKVAIGSMNRGGLAGTVFEIDDRFTGVRRGRDRRTGCRAARCCSGSTPTTRTAATLEAAPQPWARWPRPV